MKQKLNPLAAVGIIVGAAAVIGLLLYFMNNRPIPIATPTNTSVQAPIKSMSPDDIVKQHMSQMNTGGTK